MLIQKEEFQNQSNDNNQDNEINREEINNNLDELNSSTNQNSYPFSNNILFKKLSKCLPPISKC